MIIRKITINNFRQFKGKQEVEFSTDAKRNVTVILGQNTSGKTTLIQAFNWCLYESTKYKIKEIINQDLIEQTKCNHKLEVSIEVELVHDNRQYNLRRSQIFEKEINGNIKFQDAIFDVSYVEADGQTQFVNKFDCKYVVEGILPEQLSDYFFFSGEHINEINKKGNVRDAVRGLMGLEVISNSMDHFDPRKAGSVISELRKSLVVSVDINTSRLNDDLEIAQKQLEGFYKRKNELENQIGTLKADIIKIDKVIYENQETKNKQIERSRTEKEISIYKDKLITEEAQLLSDFMKSPFKFFAKPLYEKAINIIKEAKSEGEGIPNMHANSIDYILKRGRCICGTDLSRNQGAVDAINREKSLLPPASIGTLVYSFRLLCENHQKDSDGYATSIERSYKAMRLTQRLIDEKNSQLIEISKEISKKDINVCKVESDRSEMSAALDRCETNLLGNASKIGEYENEVQNIENKIDGLAAVTEGNKKIKKCISYAEEIYDWFKRAYDINIQKVKDDLSKSISELFSEMFHGKRLVEVDENYHITLKIDNGVGGVKLDPSMGEEAVKNFAFIAGLVALAREKAQKKADIKNDNAELVTEPYPLVMDAPFSNTDEEHIINISKTVPKIAEQVVFIIMEKDWNIAKKAMADRVGKVLEIEKKSETYSVLRGGTN